MKLYKLTNQDMFTRNDCRWTIGEKIELPVVPNPQLCSDQVLHSYKSLDLGLLLNPIHADIKNPRCFEAEGDICVEDYGKAGSPTLVLTKEIPLPQWYQDIKWRKTVQIRFAILCAESVLHLFETKFPDDNRPREAIKAAKNFLGATADASDAAHAADAAVYAAYVAADAAVHAAYADDADDAAAHAAYAAVHAAYAAAHAAVHAAYADDADDAAACADDAAACAADAADAAHAAHAAAHAAAHTIIDFAKIACIIK